MLTSLATALGLVAVGTQAFLVPSTISVPDSESIESLPFEHAHEAEERVLDLQCAGCPVMAEDLMGNPRALQMDNQLRLNFSVSNEDVGKVFLNGLLVYPMDFVHPLSEPLTAPQIITVAGKTSVAGNPRLGFQISVERPLSSKLEDAALDLLELRLDIVEVGEKFVNGIDSVDLKLLETSSKKLMIGDMTVIPPPALAPTTPDEECNTLLCQWRAIAADKLSKVKGCANKLRPGHRTRPKHHGHGRPRPHGTHHDGHRAHHHHHQKHSEFARFVASIVLHIFIPIAIGIMAGITASMVGMVAGYFAIFVWRTLFRRGSSSRYSKINQDEMTFEEEDGEAKNFIKHHGSPPVYDAAPAYEVVDEKS